MCKKCSLNFTANSSTNNFKKTQWIWWTEQNKHILSKSDFKLKVLYTFQQMIIIIIHEAQTIIHSKNLEPCTKYWAILFELYGSMAVDSVLSTHKYTILHIITSTDIFIHCIKYLKETHTKLPREYQILLSITVIIS